MGAKCSPTTEKSPGGSAVLMVCQLLTARFGWVCPVADTTGNSDCLAFARGFFCGFGQLLMADANLSKSIDAATSSATGNRLLDVFLREHSALQSGLQLVTYPAGHVIYRQDRPISYAYFPVA